MNLQRIALLRNPHAKPSGKRWTDPNERAWSHVNRRPRAFTQRAAFRFAAAMFP